jgi:hypothetical protein
VLIILVLLGALVLYDWRAFRNMGTQEAMDSAQVARNLAQGKGYSTLFVRPFSIFLLNRHARNNPASAPPGNTNDAGRLKTMHPDLANAPVYPVVLAGLMKVLPFSYPIRARVDYDVLETTNKPSQRVSFAERLATTITYTQNDIFTRYAPDFLIALFNQTLFFALIASVFLLARRLFDRAVAWLSAVLLVATELLWRFSVSGLSTMLVLLIFAGLVWCLVLFESEAREPKKGPRALAALAAIVGAVVGIGGLTRYAFGWLIIPVLVYILLFAGPRRVALALIAFAVFAGVMAPWIARNYHVSGTPFGTAGYAVLEKTFLFPENRLQRSLEPELGHIYVPVYGYKLIGGLRMIIQNDLPKLGGSWVSAFFLAGLMV